MGTDAAGDKIKDHVKRLAPLLQDKSVSGKDKVRLILLYILQKGGDLCFATAADYLVYNWLSIIDDVQSPLCVTCITVTITEPPPASSTAWADMQLVPNPLPSQKLSFQAVSTFQGLRGEWRLWCAFQRCYTWFHTLRETDPPTLLHKLAS